MKKLLMIFSIAVLIAIFLAPAVIFATYIKDPVNGGQYEVNADHSILFKLGSTGFNCFAYHLQLSYNTRFEGEYSALFYDNSFDVSQYWISGLPVNSRGLPIFARVRGRYENDWGNPRWTPWSDSIWFRISIPQPRGPVNGANDLIQPFDLIWSKIADPNEFDTGHQIWIDDNPDFSSPEKVINSQDTTYTITDLEYQKTYYWAARFYVDIEWSPPTYYNWSSVRSFSVSCNRSDGPELLIPANAAVNLPQPLILSWSHFIYTDYYVIQVSTNGEFDPIIMEDQTTSTSYEVTGLEPGKIYSWRVKSINECGESDWSDYRVFAVNDQTDIDMIEMGEIPKDYTLRQNYPNPFNPVTQIDFTLPKTEFITLDIFNILGEKVETLVSNEMPAGTYTVTWDATAVPSGIYFYRINTDSFSKTRKMILLK